MPEHADVVIAGARCAGSSTAAALARRGCKVIVVDPARFPSTTVSTHLLFASGVAELSRVGALERVEKIGAPKLSRAFVGGPGHAASGRYTPIDGIDYGLCVRRTALDAALVETAREAGAEVREGHRVVDLLWEGGRAVGVKVSERGGREYEVRANLVVGADGRRSTVARLAGAERPRAFHANGRACYYAYYEDPREEWRTTAAMWLTGRELGNAFPCDGGLTMVLLMPPAERAADFRGDLEAEFARTVGLVPGLAKRLEGCTKATKIVSSAAHPSYFRTSAGPGWALVGDAGHFKDPVTAQGIRDALRFGRLLGERVAGVVDDAAAVDEATRAWERSRDAQCLIMYHWTNLLGRGDGLAYVQIELLRGLTEGPGGVRRILEVYSRIRDPRETLAMGGMIKAVARALRDNPRSRLAVLKATAETLREIAGHHDEARRLLRPAS
ncbi:MULTISPECIES: NAD(P)/FAD-dependent oxidoreductase [Nonomuraea]|uniref:NAD(P)/FAD-dependent oxidoreductase n=1 Tax=Nonomuraea ferruginea TaxID=46174 RepID=A0ABT4SS51_9ACTN|nr:MULTISPECIES: NAD(P)/FAD-dependent oxidoreductase [Nonomuraea]MDA0639874.1 NAD(P)/FAD-dependent oxidoreductase [Nonomuraea ferruginea]TXK34637.1 NAD(P)/FAD-dependent oxidoreductase [Nonomuraea sp. C10]